VKRIVWTDQAKADIRSLDKTTAMRILSALHRFVHTDTTLLRFAAFAIAVQLTVEPRDG
jgi:hypothetical protein